LKAAAFRYVRSQGGYTLVELIIASAIGLMVMTGLTSVVFTSVRAATTATSRVEASNQVRSFELFAYGDFAQSGVPSTCAAPAPQVCVRLNGFQASNSVAPVAGRYQVTYTWDGVRFLDRQLGGGEIRHAATNVSAFSWSLDGTAPNQTVVVHLTVTVQSYSESQTLRFYPRLNP
jgi:prepilin-type N-terminal cleavage/methylation domain-containing protein